MMMRANGKKALRVCILICCLCLLCVGCGQKKDENGSMVSDDGRSYGGTIHAEVGETVHTAFFDLTVTSAVKNETFQFDDGLYQADEGNTYLVVTLQLENTYGEDIAMSITDFVLDYEGASDDEVITGFGKADLQQDAYMENLFTLKDGESVTKSILYTVAAQETYTLRYLEYYEDAFEGDTFEISMTPTTETTEAPATDTQETETTDTQETEATEAPATDTQETETTEAPATDTQETETTEAPATDTQATE